ncbi:Transposase DDE domain protein [Neochlamydia sp. TUME1]|nr:Transposase DDE domain protein [Neochlamydia sp. TUME1]
MKSKLMSLVDKILLRKRGIIESVNNKLEKLLSNRTSSTSQPVEFFCQSNQRNSGLCLLVL